MESLVQLCYFTSPRGMLYGDDWRKPDADMLSRSAAYVPVRPHKNPKRVCRSTLASVTPLFLEGADFGSFDKKVPTKISLNSRVLFGRFLSWTSRYDVQQKLILFLHVIIVFPHG
jgi:hypothetical protein